MPRLNSFTTRQLTDRALHRFWVHGFYASSMDDLVRATGVSRHGIYTTFGGKNAMFLACLDQYQRTVVTPAFEVVEAAGADLTSVAAYFETQIAHGEAAGLPGPGCFVANSATEVAPDDADVMALVHQHNDRLRQGFAAALRQTAPAFDQDKALELAEVMVIFTNGLWTRSRSVSDATVLRRAVENFLSLLVERTR
ncbi:TetR/AcrR family transcriptional regulator [Jannaschia sp. CCS1]|uniref:TetR/AcrR family transcriptional regulator n=1 Tax=Jannaschia sp. (strain CCS1) TaxID=290400 RepID=UPI000053A6C6|nr:TetR/AcrR family transcriptional regulator [Jannaschia sp. CCS1]ABD54929.1 transcriptional regulator, TetR family [Jannaschia sp. CCS1]